MKKDYTKEESSEDCVATMIFTFVTTAIIGIGLAVMHWPKDCSESAYNKGKTEATERYKGDFNRGWEEGVKQVRASAAENGKGRYQVDPITGKVEFVWK